MAFVMLLARILQALYSIFHDFDFDQYKCSTDGMEYLQLLCCMNAFFWLSTAICANLQAHLLSNPVLRLLSLTALWPKRIWTLWISIQEVLRLPQVTLFLPCLLTPQVIPNQHSSALTISWSLCSHPMVAATFRDFLHIITQVSWLFPSWDRTTQCCVCTF